MSESRQEIPLWTWYNGQFLFQFQEHVEKNSDKTISQFFEEFKKNQNIESPDFYQTKNQGTVILLMYGLMVIPKEIWEKKTTEFEFLTRKKFEINISPNDNLDTLDFLRLMRNSLSHANFSIDIPNSKFKFWNNKDAVKNFEVEINFGDLGEFIAEVGKYYINVVRNKTLTNKE